MANGADDQSILLDLAEKQDKFEHEYSSDLVTRIGLFLVFAGFVSGAAIELLKLILAGGSGTTTGRILALTALGLSTMSLFAAMVVLLRAAFLPGYSAPAAVSEYRERYKTLLSSVSGDATAARRELREWILDATAEAVDVNSKRNDKRATAIKSAQKLLLSSIICLFTTLVFFGVFYVRTGSNPNGEPNKATTMISRPGGLSNAESKKGEEAKSGQETKPDSDPTRDKSDHRGTANK